MLLQHPQLQEASFIGFTSLNSSSYYSSEMEHGVGKAGVNSHHLSVAAFVSRAKHTDVDAASHSAYPRI